MRRQHRTGSVYLYLLVTVTLVTLTGLSALYAVGVQRRASHGQTDAAQARMAAQSAVEVGVHMIESDPLWRSNPNTPWGQAVTFGDHSLSVELSDPIDGDLKDDPDDPVYIVGTGVVGESRHRTAVALEVIRGAHALEMSMVAAGDIVIDGTQLVSDQSIGSNANVTAQTGAQVHANVEATGTISGAAYNGTVATGMSARTLPRGVDLSYYLANGTSVDAGNAEIEYLTNHGFETDVSSWYAYNGSHTVEHRHDPANAPVGEYVVRLDARAEPDDGVAQILGTIPANGVGLDLSVWARQDNNASDSFMFWIEVDVAEGGTSRVTHNVPVARDYFLIETTLVPTWSGTATQARFGIETTTTNKKLRFDEIYLTRPAGSQSIANTLVTPDDNPWGAANAEGIFIIDCGGEDLVIEDCRIVGTLVIQNPGPNSVIRGAVSWEPAIPNYPALIVDGPIKIETDARVGVSEATLGVNLNPAGAPYPYSGTNTDDDMTDVLLSRITGIVVVDGALTFGVSPAMRGVVICRDQVTVEGTNLSLNYSNYYANNPPPGFDDTVRDLSVVPGSWAPVTDALVMP